MTSRARGPTSRGAVLSLNSLLAFSSSASNASARYELQTLHSGRERIKGRLRALQDRIKSNNAARDEMSQPGNLTPTTDPDTLKVRADVLRRFRRSYPPSKRKVNQFLKIHRRSRSELTRFNPTSMNCVLLDHQPCNGDADPSRRDFHQPYSSEAPCQTSRTWNRPDDACQTIGRAVLRQFFLNGRDRIDLEVFAIEIISRKALACLRSAEQIIPSDEQDEGPGNLCSMNDRLSRYGEYPNICRNAFAAVLLSLRRR